VPPQTTNPTPCADPGAAETRWFSEEVHVHDTSLKRYLRRSFPTVRDVDDVVQESYLRLWRRQRARPILDVAGSVKASIKSFLFQVARHLAIDTLRRRRASPIDPVTNLADLSVTEDRPGVAETACCRQECELLLEAVETLPARCREIVVLLKFQGLSPAEIALRLGISEETVRVHARRGLLRCQAFLQRRGVIRTEPS
jgi:RNA polymerase sigma factor (sigma-70 family)